MAHVLTNIRLHQALHGYADGHRLLASSAVLKPRDLRTMLVMSDASGPGAVIGEGGYLTGYPLADSGLYAFACTWAATEMSRPGCVWTHTLLIDFADLAVLESMGAFQSIFARPGDILELERYERQIVPKGDWQWPSQSAPNGELLRRLLWTLYEHPKAKVISPGDSTAADTTLRIWAQQWPRLRRTFRFCTLSFGDRSGEGSSFDLQFVPTRDRSLRLRFADSTDTEKHEPLDTEWLNEAISDVFQGTGGPLRSFLREVGGDISGGRDAFAPLCQLYHLSCQVDKSPEALNKMIELLETRFDAQSASSLRTFVILATINNLERASEGKIIDFLLEHIDTIDSEALSKASVQLGRALWLRDPRLLVDLLLRSGPPRGVADLALNAMSSDQIIEGVGRQPGTILEVLEHRPDLLSSKELWQLPGTWIREAILSASHQPEQGDAVLRALILANRSDLAWDVANAFGPRRLLKVMASTAEGFSADNLRGWLAVCLTDSSIIAELLSTDISFAATFLAAIARRTYPDFVPNEYGDDPWWTAVCRIVDDADEAAKQYLSAYLMVRALGHRSRSQASLLEYAFDAVYLPALHSALSTEAWSVLDRRLPNSWFFEWDSCRRIRDAIVEVFVNRDLSPTSFACITRDDNQFEELAKLAGQTGRGRRFLRKVAQSLKASDPSSRRFWVIEKMLS